MPQRRLLFLDATKLSAYSWQNGHLHAEGKFVADGGGVEAFETYLADHASSLFTILADVAEEGFQIEDVPHVMGRDRSALTARRLAQYFYGTPFSLAISLGREKTGRRDEKILFAALTQPRHFETWLATMRQAGIELAGIYSAPLALASLLNGTRKLSGAKLVLSITQSGVRQTFFNDGKLYFSRLSPLQVDGPEEAAVTCAVEAQKIYQYLAGQRLITRATPLDVLIMVHPAQAKTFRAHCRNSAELQFEYLDLLGLAKREKFKTAIPDSHCELLLLHELVHKPPPQQFAPPEERHFYRLWQIRSGLTTAAIVLFAACLLFAGKQYYSAHAFNIATLQLEYERHRDQDTYEAALKSLPPLSVNTEDMRTMVGRFEELAQRSPMLESTLVPLSNALNATPGIEIQHIDWKLSDKLPTTTEPTSSVFKQPPLTVSGNYYVVTEVNGQLPVALVNDHRGMLLLLNKFVDELSKEKSFGVQMTQLPFDVESGKTIKSSAEASPSQAEAPRFSFRLIQGL